MTGIESYPFARSSQMTHRAKKVSDDPVQPILDLQHRWVEALLKADTLDAILEDTYVDTG
jgi:hypothetical protein